MNEEKKIVLGIDLGTTYSCVAYVNASGQPEVLKNAEDECTTPSVVYYSSNEKHADVGKIAKEMMSTAPTEVASFIKRNMGDDEYRFCCSQGRFRPEEVSAAILKKLVKDASEKLGQEVKDVIITCPAYFFVKEREATKAAGRLAGLNVVQLLNEPTAAAISYGMCKEGGEGKTVLVYDLGGGTFDVTIIQIQKGKIEVVATDGDPKLGGKDWDEAVMRIVVNHLREETGRDDFLETPETEQELRLIAETIKKSLTGAKTANCSFTHDGEKFRTTVTRDEFEAETATLLERTIGFTDKVIEKAAQKGVARFDELLLVGGSTRMPQVVRALEAKYGMKPQIYDPDEAVAKGAAILGANSVLRDMIEERVRELTRDDEFSLDVVGADSNRALEQVRKELRDSGYTPDAIQSAMTEVVNVSSKTFGILSVPGDWADNGREELRLFNLIYPNTPLPTEATSRQGTLHDNQAGVHFTVVESEEVLPADAKMRREVAEIGVNPELGNVLWEDDLAIPSGLPKGEPLDVVFKMDKEGMLDVTCRHLATGRSIHTVIRTTATMSKEEEQAAQQRIAELIVE